MHSTPDSEAPPSSEAAHHIQTLTELNVRIARLAGALRIPIHTETAIQEALNFAPPTQGIERRSDAERRSAVRAAASPERRTNLQRFELRGLLVLRFGIEIKLVELIGAAPSRRIIGSLDQAAERRGVPPAADGT